MPALVMFLVAAAKCLTKTEAKTVLIDSVLDLQSIGARSRVAGHSMSKVRKQSAKCLYPVAFIFSSSFKNPFWGTVNRIMVPSFRLDASFSGKPLWKRPSKSAHRCLPGDSKSGQVEGEH